MSFPALRVGFHTLGCRSNFADSFDLQALVAERGAVPCDAETEADVYVVNTCTVTDAADKEAFRVLRKLRAARPQARIVVTGCLAEVGEKRLRDSGCADEVIGPGRKGAALDAIFGQAPRIARTSNRSERRKRHALPLVDELSSQVPAPGQLLGELRFRSRFHLRIQEGCENHCTFCIIPDARGALTSRPPAKILSDIEHLGERGYREVVLTGTHLGGYGLDIGTDLTALIEILEAKSVIRRLRLSSLDPNDVSLSMIERLAASEAFCPHLHLCFQSFSDSVLKRMNRRYSLSEALKVLERAAYRMPDASLGTDVITGFPGETRSDFDLAVALAQSLPFHYLHVFPYSEREDTPATRMNGGVEKAERKRRAARFRALSEELEGRFARRLIGKKVEVLREASDGPQCLGTTREFVSAELSGDGVEVGNVRQARVVAYDGVNRRVQCEL